MKSESSAEFFLMDVEKFDKKADTVIMNPPFGVKNKHSDKKFLQKAFEISNVVYSFHKSETKDFIERFAKENNFKVMQIIEFEFPLKATMKFHMKKVKKINVSCFRLVKC
jgi:putative methylase